MSRSRAWTVFCCKHTI